MGLYYLDTSAVLKRLVREAGSVELVQFMDAEPGASWVSSTLLKVEVARAVRRAGLPVLDSALELLRAFDFLAMDDHIVQAAMDEPDRRLRALDAIHLASARVLGAELDALLTYDVRLLAAARDAGVPVASPGASVP